MSLLRFLFGCDHRHQSRVFTVPRKPVQPRSGQSYVVCLECGAEFEYDLSEMRSGARIAAPRPRRWNDGLIQAVDEQ